MSKNTKTSKTISVELSYYGNGSIVAESRLVFSGGIVAPNIGRNLGFSVHREVVDENGILNPVLGEDTVLGAFQINLQGNSKGYRELGRYFLALAELDTAADPDFHEHHEVVSSDKRCSASEKLDSRQKQHTLFSEGALSCPNIARSHRTTRRNWFSK
jgi:hypothetical protein